MDVWLAGTVALMWMVSASLYGNAMFKKYSISESTTMAILFEASVLDVIVVGATTPTGAPLSQNVTLKCIQHLRQYFPNAKISVEVEKPGREGLQDLAARADVVFYSKSWAQVSDISL
ncbi:MAG: hypothetical protein Q9209_006581 [Squamulea sp. 1 TL-2023]